VLYYGFWDMVFNTTFNNISVISRWSVLLVEVTEVPGENHRPVARHWQTLSRYYWNIVESGVKYLNLNINLYLSQERYSSKENILIQKQISGET
jgi:hypothetical protein